MRVSVTPEEGWGFVERDFGTLAETFEAEVTFAEQGALIVAYGWCGRVTSAGHRYFDRQIVMTPRLVPFSGTVVLRVFDDEVAIGAPCLFDGMAEMEGLLGERNV